MTIQQQIKYDLFEAMKTQNKEVVATLRTLLGEIANAEAVETDPHHVPMAGHTPDVPRRVLTEDDIRQILQKEAASHQAAIAEFEQVGRPDAASQLQLSLKIINRYLD